LRHLVIPDTQVKPGVSLEHLEWLGRFIVHKRPDRIIMIGDWADMQSLSSYDVGKKAFEGRRYKDDVDVAIEAQSILFKPLVEYNEQQKRNKQKLYFPTLDLFLGNHEDRIDRAVNLDRKLEGLISIDDLQFKNYGWTVHPFLEPHIIDGVAYAHYFTSGVLGRPVTSAQALLTKKHMSSIMGHVQDRQIAYARRADGKQLTGIFAGTYYLHNEDYMGAQGNYHWRGVWMLHEVNDGSFDEMPVSISYLQRKYA